MLNEWKIYYYNLKTFLYKFYENENMKASHKSVVTKFCRGKVDVSYRIRMHEINDQLARLNQQMRAIGQFPAFG